VRSHIKKPSRAALHLAFAAVLYNATMQKTAPHNGGTAQTVNKAKYHSWARRALPALRFCAVSSLRGTSKTGKLAENRRFFDKRSHAAQWRHGFSVDSPG